jgi:hypothetical protein
MEVIVASQSMGRRVASTEPAMKAAPGWSRPLAVVEVVLAVVAILLDLLIPTLVLVAMAVVSLLGRRQQPRSLGLRRPARPLRMAAEVLGLSALWTVLTLALFMPAVEHLTGQHRDVSQFAPIEGNVPLRLFMLLRSWTLAACGEEFAYRRNTTGMVAYFIAGPFYGLW